jgi:acetyl-CoA acetyltransferase
MGIGPSVAIPKVLSQAGISKEDVDLFEVIRLNKSRQSAD